MLSLKIFKKQMTWFLQPDRKNYVKNNNDNNNEDNNDSSNE